MEVREGEEKKGEVLRSAGKKGDCFSPSTAWGYSELRSLVELEDICWGLGDGEKGQASMSGKKRGKKKTNRYTQSGFLPFAKDPDARLPQATSVNSQGSLSYGGGPESCIWPVLSTPAATKDQCVPPVIYFSNIN